MAQRLSVWQSAMSFIYCAGLEIVRRQSPNKLRQSLARIEEIIKEYNVERIVLGYPKNMNNTEGERCVKNKRIQRNAGASYRT